MLPERGIYSRCARPRVQWTCFKCWHWFEWGQEIEIGRNEPRSRLDISVDRQTPETTNEAFRDHFRGFYRLLLLFKGNRSHGR